MKTSTSALIASVILSAAATYASASNLDVVNDVVKQPTVVISAKQGTQLTRADVKAQFLAAQKNGDLIVGQNNETARELDPRLYPVQQNTTPPESRQQVRDEFLAAQKAGDLIINESGQTEREVYPSRFPAQADATPMKTRGQVRAELVAAQKAGDVIVNDNGQTAREVNPKAYPASTSEMDEHMQRSAKQHQVRAADRSYYGI